LSKSSPVVGLLLVFRTNTAYDRWWEGRKVLGALVNTSRNLALKLNSFIPSNDTVLKKQNAQLISNYVFLISATILISLIITYIKKKYEKN